MMTGRSVRTLARDATLQVARLVGGLNATKSSAWRSSRLLILCYHGFSQDDEHLWNSSLYVTQGHLESRLRLLAAEGYTILPLREGLARLAAGTLPRQAIAITVDDGTYDFYAIGYPVLKRLGIPVTLYVSTYYVLDGRPVFDGACQYLLWKAWASGRRDLRNPAFANGGLLRTTQDCVKAAGRILDIARQQRWSADRKHEWLEDLASRLGLDWSEFLRRRVIALMRPEEIAGLDPVVVDVQLHTHRHRVPEERKLFLREIEDNRQALAACGIDPEGLTHFCYPNGVHHPAFVAWLTEAGIRSGTTCVPGLASALDHPLLLPRFIDTGTTSEIEFASWAAGLRPLIAGVYRGTPT